MQETNMIKWRILPLSGHRGRQKIEYKKKRHFLCQPHVQFFFRGAEKTAFSFTRLKNPWFHIHTFHVGIFRRQIVCEKAVEYVGSAVISPVISCRKNLEAKPIYWRDPFFLTRVPFRMHAACRSAAKGGWVKLKCFNKIHLWTRERQTSHNSRLSAANSQSGANNKISTALEYATRTRLSSRPVSSWIARQMRFTRQCPG